MNSNWIKCKNKNKNSDISKIKFDPTYENDKSFWRIFSSYFKAKLKME